MGIRLFKISHFLRTLDLKIHSGIYFNKIKTVLLKEMKNSYMSYKRNKFQNQHSYGSP